MPRSRKGLARPPVPKGLERWLQDATSALHPTEGSVLPKLRELCEAAHRKDDASLLPSLKSVSVAGGWNVNTVRAVLRRLRDGGAVVCVGGGRHVKYVPADMLRGGGGGESGA